MLNGRPAFPLRNFPERFCVWCVQENGSKSGWYKNSFEEAEQFAKEQIKDPKWAAYCITNKADICLAMFIKG